MLTLQFLYSLATFWTTEGGRPYFHKIVQRRSWRTVSKAFTMSTTRHGVFYVPTNVCHVSLPVYVLVMRTTLLCHPHYTRKKKKWLGGYPLCKIEGTWSIGFLSCCSKDLMEDDEFIVLPGYCFRCQSTAGGIKNCTSHQINEWRYFFSKFLHTWSWTESLSTDCFIWK